MEVVGRHERPLVVGVEVEPVEERPVERLARLGRRLAVQLVGVSEEFEKLAHPILSTCGVRDVFELSREPASLVTDAAEPLRDFVLRPIGIATRSRKRSSCALSLASCTLILSWISARVAIEWPRTFATRCPILHR
ncbi:hypothetical protein [Dactylosporangium sp. NPDC051484]|uniref:hypothetical protein n=1 Tax=Dactylosporangium sp. NPDC051484 TaxID=3154942 RepID=UPI00345054D6